MKLGKKVVIESEDKDFSMYKTNKQITIYIDDDFTNEQIDTLIEALNEIKTL